MKYIGWFRVGWYYVFVTIYPSNVWRIRKLGFISYHLIRWIHGEEKLMEQGMK